MGGKNQELNLIGGKSKEFGRKSSCNLEKYY